MACAFLPRSQDYGGDEVFRTVRSLRLSGAFQGLERNMQGSSSTKLIALTIRITSGNVEWPLSFPEEKVPIASIFRE
jgi:hypothetical protein